MTLPYHIILPCHNLIAFILIRGTSPTGTASPAAGSSTTNVGGAVGGTDVGGGGARAGDTISRQLAEVGKLQMELQVEAFSFSFFWGGGGHETIKMHVSVASTVPLP